MSLTDNHSCSCEEDKQKMMAPVLASINLNALPSYASRIRQQYQYANCQERSPTSMDCAVLSPPLCGSYHILFQLEFTDGLRWIIKIPATGYRGRYDDISARALKSEALTMQLLKRETTIPIPEVYSFDASIDNELNCPYILMEFIHGITLSESWFRTTSPLVSTEQFRANVLKDVAAAMVQLNKFTYNQSGSLVFDDDGNVTGIGPAKVIDGPALMESLEKDDDNYSGFFFENGPFDDPRLCFLSVLERHPEPDMSQSDAKFDQGITALLRLFISWMPFEENTKRSGFVLKHPDLDSQNILVSEAGHLCGIIDWDGVAAAPRSIGCEQYPLWLTCDWNPFQYNYEGPDPDCPQHSPEEFAYYRTMYAGFMDLCLAKEKCKSSIQIQQGTASAKSCLGKASHFTRRSLLVQSLELASMQPIFSPYIVTKVFELIEKITASEYDSSGSKDDMQNESERESGTKSTSAGPYDSNEKETSGIAYHTGEHDNVASQLLNEEEDSSDSSLSLLIKNTMISAEKVHDDDKDDILAHQSFDEVDYDHSSSSFLSNVFKQLSGNTQDQSILLFQAYYLLDQIENTTRNGASNSAEAAAQKIDKLLGCEIGHKLQDLRDLVDENRDSIMCSIKTLIDDSTAKVIPPRLEQCGPDNTDDFSSEIHRPEETFEVVNREIEKCNANDPVPVASQSNKPNSFGDISRSGKIPVAGLAEPQPSGNSFDPSRGDSDEKLALADMNQVKMGGVGVDTNTVADTEPKERRPIDNIGTSADSIQENKAAARENPDTSANRIHQEMVTVDDDAGADASENINEKTIVTLFKNTDKSATENQDNTGGVSKSVDVPLAHSGGDESAGFFLWEIAQELADGVLGEHRMRRLKNGFLALMASLDDETVI